MSSFFLLSSPLLPYSPLFFLLAAAINHQLLRQHVIDDGKQSIAKLEQYIDLVAEDLQQLKLSVGEDCSRQDKLDLRAKVFNSRMIKEIGLYKDGVVYCTSNEGRAQIRLFNSTLQRIEASPKHVTISLAKSKKAS
ncbi:CSS-motif domain-containing protein [Vibrio sinaloensis]|nr:CSS-motif domain-containing protein [Vibrio sinaloensis]